MKVWFKFFNFWMITLFLFTGLYAQGNNSLYQDGKIYVVILVITIVLTGLILYLLSLDRKIKKLADKIHTDE